MFLAVPAFGIDPQTESEIRALGMSGGWDRALTQLKAIKDVQSDIKALELLGMAYLYTSNRLDSAGNLEQARKTISEVSGKGGSVRFIVSKSRDKRRENYLVEATPGELAIGKGNAVFTPFDGSPSETIPLLEIGECSLSSSYGSDSGSFLVKRKGSEMYFRPLHFSKTESELICGRLRPSGSSSQPSPLEESQKDGKKREKK
jgi:hypothetical protein